MRTYPTKVLAHEADVLRPCLERYYKEIGYKEAQDNPGRMVQHLSDEINTGAYVFGLFAKKQDYPMVTPTYPIGFLWFRIGVDLFNKVYCHVEAVYIEKQYRRNKLFNKLMDLLSLHSRWYRVQYYTVDAPNPLLQRAWRMMGFKPEQVHMVFRGDAEAFHAKGNNSQYYFDEEKEVEPFGKQVKAKTNKHDKPKRTSS